MKRMGDINPRKKNCKWESVYGGSNPFTDGGVAWLMMERSISWTNGGV